MTQPIVQESETSGNPSGKLDNGNKLGVIKFSALICTSKRETHQLFTEIGSDLPLFTFFPSVERKRSNNFFLNQASIIPEESKH